MVVVYEMQAKHVERGGNNQKARISGPPRKVESARKQETELLSSFLLILPPTTYAPQRGITKDKMPEKILVIGTVNGRLSELISKSLGHPV